MNATLNSRRAAAAGFLALVPALPAPAQFYGAPPDETHPWAVHDRHRPQPPVVQPADEPGGPPSDATVLFDGSPASFADNWEHEKKDRKVDWVVRDGALECRPGSGYLMSKEHFGDCQLHLEWGAPTEVRGSSQGRGNSGVFLMGLTEVQILDNYQNPTYSDGFAGSVYGVMPPAANPLRPPGQWQVFDIIFRRPIVRDGNVLDEGSMTVLLNGVVIQDATPLEGGGGHKARSKPRPFPDQGPLKIQDHGNPVRFRNIWFRPLRPRPLDGGTDGRLSPEAASAKRAEIAADLRAKAEDASGRDRLLLLMESLCYETNESVTAAITSLGEAYIADIKDTPAEKMEPRKGEIMHVYHAVEYLVHHQRLPGDHPLARALEDIRQTRGWKK